MKKSSSSILKKISNDILSIPAVEGMVIYSHKLEIIHSRFNVSQDKSHLTEFLKGIRNLLHMSMKLDMKCQAIECRFKQSTVSSYQLDNQYIMSVFFQDCANRRIIKMMVLNHLATVQEALTSETTDSPIYQPAPSKQTPQDIVIRPSLQPRLDIIRKALEEALSNDNQTNSINVMEEGIKKWATLGPLRKKELPALADILCKKITDPRKRKQFLKDIEDTFLGIR